jgi:biotin-dependent carboxylase-like uncharacterized protein
VLTLLAPGLCTLVVDHGRPAARSFGVPVGGAADRWSLAIGNALVGNAPETAALEICLSGPTLQSTCPLACVLYGAPFTLHSDRQQLVSGKTFTLAPGETLHIGGTTRGARAYFCVRGGIPAPVILGSRSSLAPLQAGAEWPCQASVITGRFVRMDERSWDDNPERRLWRDIRDDRHMQCVTDGPQADWFQKEEFFGAPENDWAPISIYTVTPSSNRMGLRLLGPPLTMPERELVSEPVCPGSVQVLRDGQCVVLGVDGQTIGGYPKIAQVISADLDLLGRLRPGDLVYFVRVSLAEAEELRRRRAAALRQWVVRLLETADLIAGSAGIGLAHRHEAVTSANIANFPENLT